MRMINIKGKRVIYPLLFLVLTAVVIFNVIRITAPEQNKVIAFRVEGGWGYRILRDERTVVDQPFIPLLPGKTPFPTRNLAKRTGNLVLDRLETGVIPVLTFGDLQELGLVY